VSILSDLQDLRLLLEDAHVIVASDREDARTRAANLLDAARALTDILIESDQVKARAWKPYWRRREDRW